MRLHSATEPGRSQVVGIEPVQQFVQVHFERYTGRRRPPLLPGGAPTNPQVRGLLGLSYQLTSA